ncbi:MAG: MBL fold metallo-hydrolase [Lachnospiraceae bacterium]|jgi:glyoxylase-like metal-dependent hydrolase (beta-lactamase superfamily II)|nr:MBL fold metallo-hydrolase [Lachnospiraceae bacterium]
MKDFKLKTFMVGPVRTNCYVISNGTTGEAIVFDPGDMPDIIEQYLKDNNLAGKGIFLTHGHFDHILGVKELAESTKMKVYALEKEAKLLQDSQLNSSARVHRPCRVIPDVLLKDQEQITLAGFTIWVIHTPGHTIGSGCYYFPEEGILISGDTLFREDIGRSDLPTGNGEQLLESIQEKLMVLEDRVEVYPGHGAPTSIGHEREYNSYIE